MLPKQRGALPEVEPGSLLYLTGVCRLVKNAAAEASKSETDFELLLCAPSHVVLLEAPPWWNWRRLLWVGGIFIGVVTVAGAWIAMILRKNRLLKQAHQELRKAADELEIRVEHRTADLAKASAELERFTYTVSHDLKSPLVTVKTFLGYLERDLAGSDKDKVRQDVAYIHTAAEKMGQLLDELLNLARVGRKMNPPERVTFRDLTQEVIKLVAGRISTGGVQVQVTDANVVLEGDRQRLMEVWQNLVENACKFMGKQSQPQVEIGVEQRGPETVFFVRDNGMGIDPRYQAKVFGLFEKLDPKAEGTGMGLSLVKRIVELYKGRIWVESAGTGQGANFLFTLPGAVMIKAE
jgi:signal transduction histidine kinase